MRYLVSAATFICLMLTGCVNAGASLPQPDLRRAPATKIITIWEENHSATQAYASMPYLKSLSNTYGKATNYKGVVHPSLGNYLVAASGQGANTCGLRDPLPAGCPQSAPNVFGQALSLGKTAKTYAESMNSNCQKTNSTGYAARHNPWVYFTPSATACQNNDVQLSNLQGAIDTGNLPNVSYLIPNLTHDAHDGTLAQADTFLQTWVGNLMAGADYQAGRLAIVVTFDEGSSTSQLVPFVVVNPSLAGKVVTGSFNHYGLCGWYSDVSGGAHLGASTSGLRAAFGL